VTEPNALSYDDLSLSSRIRLDRTCTAFEEAWQVGQPEIEPFLTDVPQQERAALVHELVLLDLEYRRARGQPCAAQEYLGRFPELVRERFLEACAELGTGASRALLSGQYEILGLIGRGGMGVVYKARQVGLNRLVAIKMILAGEHASEEALKRFHVEAEAAARLQHEGAVRIHDVGAEAGRPYLVMEYVEGGSLKDRLDGTPWPGRQAAHLIERLAQVLHAAHSAGIVHRDLKPANVLLTRGGDVKVVDFGLAKLVDEGGKLTQSGEVLGTPGYMAPEQARGLSKGALASVDVYALGAILYELLTGRPPFRGATTADTLLQVIADRPVPPRLLNPTLDRDLETVCLKCLEKAPEQRYPSAAALAEDLGRYRDHRSVLARPPGWAAAVVRSLESLSDHFAHALWAKISLIAAAVALLFHLVVYWLVHTQQPPALWLLSVGGLWGLVGAAFWRYLGPRRQTLTRAEWQVLSLWGGYALCTMALWVALGAPYDRHILTVYYPGVAVLTALAQFAQGGIYWGWCYPTGLAYLVLAITMRFTPDWAPLEMAALYSSSQLAFGWFLLRKRE
jgi:predicted Ser/Thr protein kinase